MRKVALVLFDFAKLFKLYNYKMRIVINKLR